MKKAVIVTGPHHSGKSLTINQHLKPLLGIGPEYRKFMLNGTRGYILSQSFEEALRDFLDYTEKYFRYELLVLPARPETEADSKFRLILETLKQAGYKVVSVAIQNPSEAPAKAKEAFDFLNSN